MSRLAVEENLGYKGTADQLTQMGFLGREGRPFASFTLARHHQVLRFDMRGHTGTEPLA